MGRPNSPVFQTPPVQPTPKREASRVIAAIMEAPRGIRSRAHAVASALLADLSSLFHTMGSSYSCTLKPRHRRRMESPPPYSESATQAQWGWNETKKGAPPPARERATSSAESIKMRSIFEDPLEMLRKYDLAILVDDSGSMGFNNNHCWKEASDITTLACVTTNHLTSFRRATHCLRWRKRRENMTRTALISIF